MLNLEALRNPTVYDHPAGPFKIIETHISWVVLTGLFAYKIKKPVNLGFLDFSTLDKRKFYCEEEIRTNRRLCPEIYLDVVPITGDPDHPVMGGSGRAFEYAVKMKQFDEELLWDRMLERGELQPDAIDNLASMVAGFHERAPVAPPEKPYGRPATFWTSVEATFHHLSLSIRESADMNLFEEISEWMNAQRHALAPRMLERREQGFVRELHGDLHLRNIALLSRHKPDVLIFDGIEFDDNLRWIDVINDIAFLTMDLEHRRMPAYAWRFLNSYLEITGDYMGLDLLRFYETNRALVRAKVLAIQHREAGAEDFPPEARSFLKLAETYTSAPTPRLYITHGLSGSGKTTATKELLEKYGAIRLRSDIERKRLFGLGPAQTSSNELKVKMYGPEGTRRTYDHLKKLTRYLIAARHSVIVDAAFLKRNLRKEFRDFAKEARVDFKILDFHADEQTLRQRLQERSLKKNDASEADIAVLTDQIKNNEGLTEEELRFAVRMVTI